MTDRGLLLERLERLAIVLDESMPQCAELVRDALTLLKENREDSTPITFGELFVRMHPGVKVVKNGTCVWLYYDNVNHYTLSLDWWDEEVK